MQQTARNISNLNSFKKRKHHSMMTPISSELSLEYCKVNVGVMLDDTFVFFFYSFITAVIVSLWDTIYWYDLFHNFLSVWNQMTWKNLRKRVLPQDF